MPCRNWKHQPSPGQSLTTPVAWSLFPEALMVVISRTVIRFCQQKNFRRKYTVLPEWDDACIQEINVGIQLVNHHGLFPSSMCGRTLAGWCRMGKTLTFTLPMSIVDSICHVCVTGAIYVWPSKDPQIKDRLVHVLCWKNLNDSALPPAFLIALELRSTPCLLFSVLAVLV